MSDVLWTDGMDGIARLRDWETGAMLFIEGNFVALTPDECDALAAALTQAANKKRSEDRVRQLEQARANHFECDDCGDHVASDEDGCCTSCGEVLRVAACDCDEEGEKR